MIRTIETDPASPFGPPEVPPAEWTYRHVSDDAFRRGPQYAFAWLRQAGVTELPDFPTHRSLERHVSARVCHSRWLWDCPLCGAAQCCTPNDPRAFCVGCFNRRDGYWPVLFPDDRAAIETLLSRRPLDEQRNWTTETVETLQMENLSIGCDPNIDGHPWECGDALELVRSYRAERGLDAGRADELVLGRG